MRSIYQAKGETQHKLTFEPHSLPYSAPPSYIVSGQPRSHLAETPPTTHREPQLSTPPLYYSDCHRAYYGAIDLFTHPCTLPDIRTCVYSVYSIQRTPRLYSQTFETCSLAQANLQRSCLVIFEQRKELVKQRSQGKLSSKIVKIISGFLNSKVLIMNLYL